MPIRSLFFCVVGGPPDRPLSRPLPRHSGSEEPHREAVVLVGKPRRSRWATPLPLWRGRRKGGGAAAPARAPPPPRGGGGEGQGRGPPSSPCRLMHRINEAREHRRIGLR